MKDTPQGFHVLSEGADLPLTITYKSHGMGCMLAFFLAVPLGVGGPFLIFAIVSPSRFHDFVFATWWMPILFLGPFLAMVYILHIALFNLFGSTKFVATERDLTVSRTLWFWTRESRIKRTKIREFVQFKDGGGNEDSFPSWGLKATGTRTVNLLLRQPIEKSDWLGELLARHFGVEYVPSHDRD